MVGEPVTVTATPSNFNPKHPLSYDWSSNAGKVTGKDTTATIDTGSSRVDDHARTDSATAYRDWSATTAVEQRR